MRLDSLFESSLIAVFVDKVVIIGSFKNFDKADDMGWVFDFGESIDLVDGELFEFGTGAEFLYLDYLDGHNLASFFVISFVDFSKLSCTDSRLQNVIFDFLSHFFLLS